MNYKKNENYINKMNYLWLTKILIDKENVKFYPKNLKQRIITDSTYLKPQSQYNILSYYNINK